MQRFLAVLAMIFPLSAPAAPIEWGFAGTVTWIRFDERSETYDRASVSAFADIGDPFEMTVRIDPASFVIQNAWSNRTDYRHDATRGIDYLVRIVLNGTSFEFDSASPRAGVVDDTTHGGNDTLSIRQFSETGISASSTTIASTRRSDGSAISRPVSAFAGDFQIIGRDPPNVIPNDSFGGALARFGAFETFIGQIDLGPDGGSGILFRSEDLEVVSGPPIIPLPASVWTLLAAVGGLATLARRRKARSAEA
jgi:hypothetical protein